MGAHRNRFEQNVIVDNGTATDGDTTWASIVIRGAHHDLQFRENTIGYTKPPPADRPAIRVSREARGLMADENQFRHVSQPVTVRTLTDMTLFVIGCQRLVPLVRDTRALRQVDAEYRSDQ